MIWPLPVSASSGSAPRRPTRVIRARCAGRVVEKVRAEKLGTADVMRRAGVKRKDIVKVRDAGGWESAVCGMRRPVVVGDDLII